MQKPFSESGNPIHFAYHNLLYWQLTGQWNKMGNGSKADTYVPELLDIEAQMAIQDALLPFILYGTPGNGSWRRVNSDQSWPKNYTINVLKTESPGFSPVTNYRENVCSYYHQIGLDEQVFWWAN